MGGAEMNRSKPGVRFPLGLLLLLGLFLGTPALGAQDPEEAGKVRLNADRVEFDEASGTANATGNVRLSHKDFRLFSPYLEYDTEGQKVRAMADPGGQVTLFAGGKKLSGQRLDYDLVSRRGVLQGPSGQVDQLYLRGKSIEFLPLEDAQREGWAPKRTGPEAEDAARWTGVTVTTCDKVHPHYRLQAREVVVVPGDRVVVKNPRVYLGEHLLFTYPFDYVIRDRADGKKSETVFFPMVQYDGDKGLGLGIRGPLAWGTGELDLGIIGWTKEDPEGWAHLTQQIRPGVSLFARVDRLYDKDAQDLLWRPQWGLEASLSRWYARVLWTERELVTQERRTGVTDRFSVWRSPEFEIRSPWEKDPASGAYWRFRASYGDYEDATVGSPGGWVTRRGASLELYGETPRWGIFRPFAHVLSWYYDYPDTEDYQRVTDAEVGFRWALGDVNLQTTYVRRWVDGESPMGWDSWDAREDLYQEISFLVAKVSPEELWRLSVRGGYDLISNELGEMVYRLSYDRHCLVWELVARDDMRGDDDWVGLRLIVKAYPNTAAAFGTNKLFEPGARPEDLPETGKDGK